MAWAPTTDAERFLFRPLDDLTEEEFRVWARKNSPPNDSSWACYHPVVREEWCKRGLREVRE